MQSQSENIGARDVELARFEQMYLIRRFEETLFDLYDDGHITGTIHTAIGQESCAVGVLSHVDPATDIVWSNHRGHGHYLAFTDDVDGLLREILGREGGVSGGIGGSQHIHSENFYTNGVLGTTVAAAVGSALSRKLRDEPGVVVVFVGDGAMGEGVTYEAMNMASLWSVPLLIVLEHNQYAQATPWWQEHGSPLEDRPSAFGIPTEVVDAADVAVVSDAAKRILNDVRGKREPRFLVLHTYRLSPHSKGDDTRDPAEIALHAKDDPVGRSEGRLAEAGHADAVENAKALVDGRITDAVTAAVAARALGGG